MLEAALEILGRENLHVLEPATAPIRPTKLHGKIVNALAPGIPPVGADNIGDFVDDGSRFVLSIDNAHALTAEALRYLWLILQEHGALTYSRLQIIFVGLPQFWSLLEEDVLSPLRERTVRLELSALRRAEVWQYLNHFLGLQGCRSTWRSRRELRHLISYAGTTPAEINGFASHLLNMGWPDAYDSGQGRSQLGIGQPAPKPQI